MKRTNESLDTSLSLFAVQCHALQGEGRLCTGSYDGTVRLWDGIRESSMQVLQEDREEGPLMGITSLCASSVNGAKSICWDDDGVYSDSEPVKKCWVATGTRDGIVHMWSSGGEKKSGRIVSV